LFLGCGYKVNVHFDFRSRQTQAGMQVSSAILFPVQLLNRVTIEKAFYANYEHVAHPVQSLLSRGAIVRLSTPWLWVQAWLPSIISRCFPRICVVFPVYFLKSDAVMPL